MAKLPKPDPLHQQLESGQVPLEFRPYIGMSGLLGKCPRDIWYNFRWAHNRTVEPRVMRIFKRGDIEESRVIQDMEAIGLDVQNHLNEQIELVDETGHIKGHPDGSVTGLPYDPGVRCLLEIKTMKQSQYTKYKKEGLQKSHPSYWGQIHTYMGESELLHCLFIVVNKDTEERSYTLYAYDPAVHKECMQFAYDILVSERPPNKIGESTWFACKFCANRPICHFGEPIKQTCRSCKHVNIENKGKFTCGLHGYDLNYRRQMDACPSYELDEVFD